MSVPLLTPMHVYTRVYLQQYIQALPFSTVFDVSLFVCVTTLPVHGARVYMHIII